jgi:hypothetical protein
VQLRSSNFKGHSSIGWQNALASLEFQLSPQAGLVNARNLPRSAFPGSNRVHMPDTGGAQPCA